MKKSCLEIAHSCFNAKFWPQYNAVKYAIPYINPTGSIVLMSGAFGQRPLADEAAHTTIYLMTNIYTTGSTLFPDGGYILR